VDVVCRTAPCGSAQSIFTCGMGGASAECGAASGVQRTRSRKAQEVKVRGGGCHLREDKLPVDDWLVYDRHPAASYLRRGLGKSAGRGVGSAAAAAAAERWLGEAREGWQGKFKKIKQGPPLYVEKRTKTWFSGQVL
jgi:hypothetical protein